jgi:hypothetical protein
MLENESAVTQRTTTEAQQQEGDDNDSDADSEVVEKAPVKKQKQGSGQGTQQGKRKAAEVPEVARTAAKQDKKAKGEHSESTKRVKVATAVETGGEKKGQGKQVGAGGQGVKVKSKKQRSN